MRSVRVATFVLMMLTGCRRNDDAPLAPHAHPRETELSDPRAGALGPVDGDGGIEREIRHEQDAFRTHPHDAHSAITLGRLFIRKAREEEDPGWYAQANDAIRRALDLDPQNVEAAQVHALLLLQDHRFREARDAATALQVRAPTADTFAILSDANLELGDYDAAVAAAQRMIDLRPDGAAYVRVAWLRWVHGDWAGARDVMLLALDALPRSPESRAWIVTQMGVLYWNAGDRTHASRYFNQALAFDATFSAAHAGLARVALASGDPPGAV
jgi:tetratricopeptide (TPR) repeat protein